MKVNAFREIFRTKPEEVKFNNGFQSKFFAEDPTFLSFALFFEFNSPLLNSPTSPGESAQRYFERIGDKVRAEKVIEFRERLLSLIQKTPYLLKSITGLENIYDYKREEIYLEREIEISTYETTDLRIAKLAELYTDIVWDWSNHRRKLPSNLEWINYHIIVNDFRNIVKYVESENGYTFQNVSPYLKSYVFSFKSGKFYFGNSNNFLSELSSEEPTMADNSFKLIGGRFSKSKSTLSVTELSGENESELTKSFSRQVTANKKSIMGQLVGQAKDMVIDYAKQEIKQLAYEHVIDPLKAKIFEQLNYNVLFRGEDFDLSGIISGRQDLKDTFRNFKGVDGQINNIILNKRLASNDPDVYNKHADLVNQNILNKESINLEGLTKEQLINLIINRANSVITPDEFKNV